MFNPIDIPNIVVDESLPEGTLYFVPKIEHIRYVNMMTGEEKEVMQWNAKQGAVISNIGKVRP